MKMNLFFVVLCFVLVLEGLPEVFAASYSPSAEPCANSRAEEFQLGRAVARLEMQREADRRNIESNAELLNELERENTRNLPLAALQTRSGVAAGLGTVSGGLFLGVFFGYTMGPSVGVPIGSVVAGSGVVLTYSFLYSSDAESKKLKGLMRELQVQTPGFLSLGKDRTGQWVAKLNPSLIPVAVEKTLRQSWEREMKFEADLRNGTSALANLDSEFMVARGLEKNELVVPVLQARNNHLAARRTEYLRLIRGVQQICEALR